MNQSDIEKLLKKENHIASLSLRSMFDRSAKPFYACVTKDQDGVYSALKEGMVKTEGTALEGVDDYFSEIWVGSDKDHFEKTLSSHFNAGGIFAFTAGGAHKHKAAQRALELAQERNKAVMYLHNDTMNVARANGVELKSTKFPGFYKN